MVKRTTALFFILFANIVLLANAVIPHHHHKDDVCIEDSHCQTDNENHKHQNSESNHDHEHDKGDQTDNCALSQTVVINSNQEKHELKYFDCEDKFSQIYNSQAVLNDKNINSYLKVISRTALPHLNSTYVYFASNIKGLRAPPPIV